jgi:hypothetical protein
VFPLLSPTTFFLLVVNVVYAFFETFGVIHTITQGGPQQATTILVYKVYRRRLRRAGPRLLGRAVGDPSGAGHRPDGGPVPLHRTPGALLMSGMVEKRGIGTWFTHAGLIRVVHHIFFRSGSPSSPRP